ncbi:unnamed protein product [Trichobilharzia szidati]|nr:unnamed protein product [Trichobilharzia szidati]
MDDIRLLFSHVDRLLPSSNFSDPNLSARLNECIEAYLKESADASLRSDVDGAVVDEAFYLCCMHFLYASEDIYNRKINNNISEVPLFSVPQEEKLSKCIEFVVGLGIYPLLDAGVSFPLSMRVESYGNFLCSERKSDEKRFEKLMKIIKCLLCLQRSKSFQLQRLISSTSFLGDLIASLFQSAYGMDLYIKNNNFTSEKISSLMACACESRKILWKLLLDLPRHIAMKELMILQGGSSSNNKLLEILQLKNTLMDSENDSGAISLFFYDTAIKTVHELCQKFPDLGKNLLLWPLIGSLREFCQIPSDIPKEKLITNTELSPFDLTVKRQLASQDELARLLEYLKHLLDCPEPSSVIVQEICKLSRPLFLLLAQTIEDEKEANDESGSCYTSLKEFLIQMLINLLSCSSISRLNRLSLIRSWFNLPLPSLEFMPLELRNELSSSSNPVVDLLSAYTCHENMMFKSLPKVHFVESFSSSQTVTDVDSNKPASIYVPYTCVLMNHSMHTINGIQNLSSCIDCLIVLLCRMSPTPPATAVCDDDVDEEHVSCHLRHLISEKENETSRQQSEITTHVDLFLSLITDIHFTSQAIFESLNKVNISQDEKCSITETGTVCALLASAMLESLDDLIWPQDVNQACNLFQALFSRFVSLLQHVDNHEYVEFLHEMLSQLLGILAFYANKLGPVADNGKANARDEFASLLPVLNQLERVIEPMTNRMGTSTLNLLQCIKVTLATRGAIPCNNLSSTDDCINNSIVPEKYDSKEIKLVNRQSKQPCKLIEEVITSNNENVEQPVNNQPIDPSLQKIFEELRDPLIPVQGHALIMLSRLLESKDSCITGHEQLIFEVLTNYLSHTDSYIYLNAIRCLSAMGRILTDKVLNLLLNQFCKSIHHSTQTTTTDTTTANKQINIYTNDDHNIEYKLKLTESVMRILSNLGDMAPKYRTEVFNTFVIGCKSSDELIRAACLSNIAELVRLLKYAIHPIIYEIFTLIEIHLCQDTSHIVRKAAAYLARSIFVCGNDENARIPSWIPEDILRDLNRLLSTRRSIEKDASVQEQIEAALAQLDLCTRNTVFLKPDSPSTLVKQIRILNP